MSTSQTEAKPRFLDRLSDFLQKARIPLLALLIAAIAVLIGYFVWHGWQARAREKSALLSEKAQDLHQEWIYEQEEGAKKKLETELADLLQHIFKKYPRQYAAQRARLIEADLAYRARDWAKAAAAYQALASGFPRSYLAPLSLLYSGACYEELGDGKKALEAYERIRARYRDSYLMPQVLFASGRLLESDGDFAGASKAYTQLEESHPDSNWTKLARNRIIDLKLKGKIQE